MVLLRLSNRMSIQYLCLKPRQILGQRSRYSNFLPNVRSRIEVRIAARCSAAVYTCPVAHPASFTIGRLRLKCDGTRAETRFRPSAKRTSPFKSARASVQSTAGS